MLKLFKNVRLNVSSMIIITTLFVSQTAFAAFGDSVYATGTKNLVHDVFFWLTTVLIPATAALMIGYQAWRKKVADGDGGTITDANKAIKRILIAAIIGETSAGLVTLVSSYYGVTA